MFSPSRNSSICSFVLKILSFLSDSSSSTSYLSLFVGFSSILISPFSERLLKIKFTCVPSVPDLNQSNLASGQKIVSSRSQDSSALALYLSLRSLARYYVWAAFLHTVPCPNFIINLCSKRSQKKYSPSGVSRVRFWSTPL